MAKSKTHAPGGRPDALPQWIKPQLTRLVDEPPPGPDWLHEIKFDGYRMHAQLDHGSVRLLTRTGLDWTRKYPAIASAVSALRATQAYLDGELCGVRPDGTTSFSIIQTASDGGNTDALVFFLFDLLEVDGEDISAAPLQDRKGRLAIGKVVSAELVLPITIRIQCDRQTLPLFAAMPRQISLAVSIDIEPSCHPSALNRRLPDGGVDGFPCHSMSRGRPTFTESNRAIVLISSQERPRVSAFPPAPISLPLIERQIESVKLRPTGFIVTTGRNSLSLFPSAPYRIRSGRSAAARTRAL